MASRRLVPALAAVAVVGGGYYLYSAGGDPKLAEKKLEHDAASISAKLRSEVPGRGKEAQKASEEWAAQAGAKLDKTVAEAKAKGHEFDAKLEAKMGQADAKIGQLKEDGIKKLGDIRKETDREIDQFDKTVERKAAEAKSGIASWLGFGK